jgi:hypothetical protein
MASDEAPARPTQPAAVPATLASYVKEHDECDELTEASNAVVDMVQAGDLDIAEQAAHDLLARFPDVVTATIASPWSAKPAAIIAKPPTTTAKPSTSSATTPTTTILDSRPSSKGSSTGSKPRRTPPPAEPAAGRPAAPASPGAQVGAEEWPFSLTKEYFRTDAVGHVRRGGRTRTHQIP